MDRRQVRTMIRTEAVIITLLGTLLGMDVGLLTVDDVAPLPGPGVIVGDELLAAAVESVPATDQIKKDYGYSKWLAWIRKQ